MLGRKDYTQEELDRNRTAMAQQLGAWQRLVAAVDTATDDPAATAALDEFEPLFFNNLTLALDRPFVHRLRSVTGKDGTPLNELELLADALMNNDGVLRTNNVIKYKPEESVLKLEPGEHVALTAAQFERLSDAVHAEIEAKYVAAGARAG